MQIKVSGDAVRVESGGERGNSEHQPDERTKKAVSLVGCVLEAAKK